MCVGSVIVLLTDIKCLLIGVGLEAVPILPVVQLHATVGLVKEGEINNRLDHLWSRRRGVGLAEQTVELACR